jgi:hypothetical protein
VSSSSRGRPVSTAIGSLSRSTWPSARGHLRIEQELILSLALTALILGLSLLELPPASRVIAWNEQVKRSWVTSPELEPAFGHLEEASLAGIARRADLDLPSPLPR